MGENCVQVPHAVQSGVIVTKRMVANGAICAYRAQSQPLRGLGRAGEGIHRIGLSSPEQSPRLYLRLLDRGKRKSVKDRKCSNGRRASIG